MTKPIIEHRGSILERATELDLSALAFYARAYALGRRARWQDAAPDSAALRLVLSQILEQRGTRESPIRALDLGAGAGRNTRFLLEEGCSVVAVDQFEKPLRELRASVASSGHLPRLRIVHAPASRVERYLPNEVDLVLDVLGPITDLAPRKFRRLMQCVSDWLSVWGTVLVATSEPARLRALKGRFDIDEESLSQYSTEPLNWMVLRKRW